MDQLSQCHTYRGMGSLFDKAFAYLKGFDLSTPDGKYPVEGDSVYALVQSFDTTPSLERTFESHRLYADIQYVISGNEAIYYQTSSLLVPKTAYDPAKDATYYEDADDYPLYLRGGDFTVFWPQDGHKPGCIWQKPSAVRKVVMKVFLEV